MKRLSKAFILGLLLAFSACNQPKVETTGSEESQYSPSWESLAKHTADPEWFRDAKFGIYFHWGVYSVPAFKTEWYPYHLYRTERPEFAAYHEENFGTLSEFGYHDFIPQFTAENFDPEDWADLFQKSGARFAGPVAQHHDGFAMWDSEVNPWNAADMGPKRDITGELLAALKKRNMKTITTFHHARLRQRHEGDSSKWDTYNSHYAYHPDYPTSSEDPLLRKFYGNMPKEEFEQYWLDQVNEVVDNYSPDILWYDVWLNHVSEPKIMEMASHFLNHGKETGQELVLIAKHDDLPKNMSVLDIEQGGKKDVSENVWMTDITISFSSWSHTKDQEYKPVEMVLRNMVDVWSKYGVVLLNVSPMADGTISQVQRDILLNIGEWLDTYGEAVYATEPFKLFGHGSTKESDGAHGGQSATTRYGVNDIRYTVSKDRKSLYVFVLGRPSPGMEFNLKINNIGYGPDTPVKRVIELGSGQEVEWEETERKYSITAPEVAYSDLVNVFKMELE